MVSISTGEFLNLLTGSQRCPTRERCTARCEADEKYTDESVCLLADNVRNELVKIHR
jgi:hypothetical protein